MREPTRPTVKTVSRRLAMSERVSYGDPVVLHETSRSRVVMVPLYIPRSNGEDLAIKIVTYRKSPPPHDWQVKEEKSISLDAGAVRTLHEALLEHLAITGTQANGKYLSIRVDDGTPDLTSFGPETLLSALSTLVGRRDFVEFLTGHEVASDLLYALRSGVRVKELQAAMAELRGYLDSGEGSEQVYQSWCERHNWAFGNAYLDRDSVRAISAGDNTDLLLPSVMTGFRDVIELKRPDVDVLKYDPHHRNYYFSSDTSKAIGQCHRYLDVLHEEAADGLRDHREVVAHYPRATIVIGRSQGWNADQRKALHGLNCRLHGINVMTYDHLLAQGERLLEILTAELDGDAIELEQSPDPEYDENFPF